MPSGSAEEHPSGMKKRIDVAAIAPIVGTLYPAPFDEPCRSRARNSVMQPG
jgi:hypothetical protein